MFRIGALGNASDEYFGALLGTERSMQRRVLPNLFLGCYHHEKYRRTDFGIWFVLCSGVCTINDVYSFQGQISKRSWMPVLQTVSQMRVYL